jgi:F-type H+-transporting ATPase subunit delta
VTPGSIARRYGRAIFELASEAKSLEEVSAALSELGSAVESLEEGALAPGLLTPEQRQKMVSALVARTGGDSLMSRFLGVLATNDRLDQLPAIRRSFEKLSDAAAGRVRIVVRSAKALDDAERAAVRGKFEKITGKTVLDTVELDETLLGGVTVEAEGRVYDGSVRTQLALLERRMAGI